MRPRNYDQDYNKSNVRKYLVGKRRMVLDDLDRHRPQRACRLSVRTGIDYMTSDDDMYEEKEEERPRRHVRRPYLSSDDEPMFTPPTISTRRLRGSTTTSRHDGIRRSQRQRKLKYENCNDSWIFGSQSLRGYPSLATQEKKEDPIEEDEEDEEEEEEEEEEPETQEKPPEQVKESKKKIEKLPPFKEEIKKESSEDEEEKEESYRADEAAQIEKSEEESSDEDMPRRRMRTRNNKTRNVKMKYSLRKKKPTVQRFQITAPSSSRLREMITRSFRRKRRRSSSSSSSSSSDGRYDRERDRNRDRDRDRDRDRKHGKRLELAGKSTGKLADVDPISLDQSIRFSNIGGLEKHVDCLKEMILFPILYPEIFSKFNVAPPKGVLFHGPPGTGKTLMARALANECSIGGRKVSFFMRKGADCLSKWVGESERQLRILFQEAHEGRPSIIFFDELDGLAPVRSSKQDQIHASIVCTLLALMDGLDNRGDIIVIGATNRIDSIDPALRRPGRFDRELHFPLPGVKERLEILGIHASWAEKGVLNKMAETTAGYCGSDLKHLATEAVIQSLKRIYPQIYSSNKKLLLDVNRVKVTSADFESAQRSIIPASQRGMYTLGRKLPLYLEPLLSQPLAQLLEYVGDVFPPAFNRQSTIRVRRPSLLMVGEHKEVTFLATALLYKLEHCPTLSISFETLFSDSSRSPEETLTKVFKELPHSSGSILWFGDISLWWRNVTDTVKAVLTSLLSLLDPSLPIFFIATSTEEPPNDLNIFSDSRHEIFRVSRPTEEMRKNFFRPLFRLRSLKKPPSSKKERVLEQLEEAPPTPPPKLTKEQIENLYKGEENTLRELRIFLRQTCAKLARNKQFYMFSKPVDTNEVIQEPMDLETMMTKIDLHKYTCAEDFLKDIDMICANALEYNPDRDPADKLIRHRACYLRDTAYALIKTEMDSDFEVTCRSIRDARKNRIEGEAKDTEEVKVKNETGVVEEKKTEKRRRRNAWSKGIVKKPKRSADVSTSSKKSESSATIENGVESSLDGDHHDESFTSQEEVRTVIVDRNRLDQLFLKTISATDSNRIGFDNLVDLYSTIAGLIDSYSDSWDRTKLPDDLEEELDKFIERQDID